MADNTTLNIGTGGDVIATDDLTSLNGGVVSGVKVERVKVGFGSDASLRDVDSTHGLPSEIVAALPTGSNTIGKVDQGAANATPWNENLAQVGGTAIAAKAASTFGVAAIPVWPNAVQRDTYCVCMNGIALAVTAGGGDKILFSIEHAGAATKTVRIRRILISGVVTTASAAVAGNLRLNIFRGTAASSAGTAVTPTATNAASSAAEASCKHTPTIVAATGPLASAMVLATGTGGATVGTLLNSSSPVVLYDWQENGETVPMTLRSGNLESIVVSANGSWATTAPTITWGITIIFTEE